MDRKKKKKRGGPVLNPLRPSLVLKKYQRYDFGNFEGSSPLDSATRKRWFKVFSHILIKSTPRKASFFFFLPERLARFFYWRRLNHRSPEHNMIKVQTVEVVSVTTAFLLKVVVELRRLPRTSFPRQNDPGSITRVHYLINLKKVVLFII